MWVGSLESPTERSVLQMLPIFRRVAMGGRIWGLCIYPDFCYWQWGRPGSWILFRNALPSNRQARETWRALPKGNQKSPGYLSIWFLKAAKIWWSSALMGFPVTMILSTVSGNTNCQICTQYSPLPNLATLTIIVQNGDQHTLPAKFWSTDQQQQVLLLLLLKLPLVYENCPSVMRARVNQCWVGINFWTSHLVLVLDPF